MVAVTAPQENRKPGKSPDGTATVCVEVLHLTKVGHWGNLRRLCRTEDAQVRRTAQMRENHRNLQVRVSVFFVVESGCGNPFSVLLQSFFCVSVEYCLSMQAGNPVRFRNNRPFLYWIPWDPKSENLLRRLGLSRFDRRVQPVYPYFRIDMGCALFHFRDNHMRQ